MSADDLEGDDIWGDSGGAADGESKQADNEPDAAAAAAEDSKMEEEPEDEETRHMSISELRQRIHLLSNDIRVMKSDVQRITHESRGQRDRIKENQEKVKLNKQLPYLVANVVEVLEPDAEDGARMCSSYCLVAISLLLFMRLVSYHLFLMCHIAYRHQVWKKTSKNRAKRVMSMRNAKHVRQWSARAHDRLFSFQSLVSSIRNI